MSEPFALGDRVTIHATMRKVKRWPRTDYETDGIPTDRRGDWRTDRKFTEGIVVGQRTMPTGETDLDLNFFQDGTVTVYLVAFDLHRVLAMCAPDQITRKEVQS